MPDLLTIDWHGSPHDLLTLDGTDKVAYTWDRCMADPSDKEHVHAIDCLWVWHDCPARTDDRRLLGAVPAGDRRGWTPSGVLAHTLVEVDPLHLEASLHLTDCCGMHGFIRDGAWVAC